jgi:hypothetical protein
LVRTSRAWAYVALAAAFEEFVREFVDELAVHVNTAAAPLADLVLGIVSLTQASQFDSAADLRRQPKWDKRAEIMQSANSATVGQIVPGLRPLDGRTIRQWHLDSIWNTFEIPGSPLPSPLHALALKDLSEGRNDVAHGIVDPLSFGAQKTYYDLRRRVEQVEDISIHMAIAGASYVGAAEYLR